MYAFAYARPGSLDEVRDLLANDVEPRLLAGGQTLLPAMKHRLTAHSTLIDLQGIEELKGIERRGADLVIGAMARHAEVALSPQVRAAIPALAVLAGGIADPSVRNMGTIGGSLANSDPAADYPAALLGLGGTVITDRREIAADDWFQGMFATALEPGEIICAVRFPIPDRAGYCKIPNRASGYVLVGAFVVSGPQGIRLAINGAGECAFRLAAAERRLTDNLAPLEAEALAISPQLLVDDPAAPRAYKQALVPTAVNRAIERALNPPFQSGERRHDDQPDH